MTDEQITSLRKALATADFGVTKIGNKAPRIIKEIRQLMNCVEMINSVLAYNWNGETAKNLLDWELSDRYKSYLKEYVNHFGYDVVLDLMKEQMMDIAEISKNVFTDDEGISYNKIVWKNYKKLEVK